MHTFQTIWPHFNDELFPPTIRKRTCKDAISKKYCYLIKRWCEMWDLQLGQLTSALLIVSFIFLMKIMKGQIIPRSHRRSSTSSFIMNSKACLLVFGFLLVFVILACAGEENNDNSLSEEIESSRVVRDAEAGKRKNRKDRRKGKL